MCMKLTVEQRATVELQEFEGTLPPLSEELSRAELGSKPLQKRLVQIVEMLSKAPEKSFPKLANGGGDLKGFYRFVNHEKVTPEKLSFAHAEATCQRADTLKKVMALYDTTGVGYGGQVDREGLGRINDGGHGYFVHGCLLLSAEGSEIPLGVPYYEILIRTGPPKKPRNWREERDDPDKESRRWPRGALEVASYFEGSSTIVVHVMDSEADDYELLAALVMAEQHFVIRLKHDRLLDNSSVPEPQEGQEGSARKVREALSHAEVVLEREVRIQARKPDRSPEKRKTHPARSSRIAHLHVAAQRLRIRRPDELWDKPIPEFLDLGVVHVWEVGAPEGVEPVEWYLMTTEPIDSAEQIPEVVDFYCARWVIEEFWKALKTGCALQKRQLTTKKGLLNALALFLPIAWRLLLLRNLGRVAPQLPATTVLSETQLEILRKLRPKMALPPEPSLGQAMYAVASLGGHLKHNGPPGWQTLGEGFQKLLTLEEGYHCARGS
jgi:transposase-like protein/DDE family transposase